ncbi:hypothetical protein M2408_001368 [Sphingobacterium sp. BIGb0165]|nr:hypothetical protein [Sphingobacterium sp. BIGb0165]
MRICDAKTAEAHVWIPSAAKRIETAASWKKDPKRAEWYFQKGRPRRLPAPACPPFGFCLSFAHRSSIVWIGNGKGNSQQGAKHVRTTPEPGATKGRYMRSCNTKVAVTERWNCHDRCWAASLLPLPSRDSSTGSGIYSSTLQL